MDSLAIIEKAKSDLVKGLAGLDKDIEVKTSRRLALHEENAVLEQTIADLSADFEQKKAEFSEKISQNQEILEKLLADGVQANTELAKALAALTAAKKQHKDFMEYRKRANAVLESHESAILDKEKKLDNILNSAKRRTSILANI